jgi:SAM-dependent methyltransferase
MFPPSTLTDPEAWDEFWRRRFDIGFGPAECHMFAEPAEIAAVLAANGLRRILCVGSGPSHEPWVVARAGYDVTVLDLSPFAIQKAQESVPEPSENLRFVVGDLMNPGLCPGPFDLVLERRTLQLFAGFNQLDAAMTAVANRLDDRGILFSHCHDGGWRPPAEPRHVTGAWLMDRGWRLYRPQVQVIVMFSLS